MGKKNWFRFHRYAKSHIKGEIETYVLLTVLVAVIAATGTTFFGMNYLPLILLILAVVFIAAKWDDAKKIFKLLKDVFGH